VIEIELLKRYNFVKMKKLLLIPLCFLAFSLTMPFYTTPTVVVLANGVSGTINITHNNINCEDDGVNWVTLNGRNSTSATGIPMLWNWVWTKQSYTGAGTGKAAFENTNGPVCQVDSLDVGTYVFQGSATDGSGGSAGSATITVVVAAASSCPVWTVDTMAITPGTGAQIIITGDHYKIHYIRPGTYGSIYGNNFGHVILKPVPNNLGNRVISNGDAEGGDCCVAGLGVPGSFLTIDGSGVTGITGNAAGMGIKINGFGNSGHGSVFRIDSSRSYKLLWTELEGGYNHGNLNGQGVSWAVYNSSTNDTITPNQTHTRLNGFNAGNDTIKNCWIHGSVNEGVYDGGSHFGYKPFALLQPIYLEPVLNSFYMANCIIDTCGQSGINIGACINGAVIENNYFGHYALNQHAGHEGGINANPGTHLIARHNVFFNELPFTSQVEGINYQSAGPADLIYDNIFIGLQRWLVLGRSTDQNQGNTNGNLYVLSNTVIRPQWIWDVYSQNWSGPGRAHVKGNIIAGSSMLQQANGNDWTLLDTSNNVISLTGLAPIKFIDTLAFNFGLASGSLAIGAGYNSIYFNEDYNYATQNVPADAGYLKYTAAGTGYIYGAYIYLKRR
jgi:hypothetical protein